MVEAEAEAEAAGEVGDRVLEFVGSDGGGGTEVDGPLAALGICQRDQIVDRFLDAVRVAEEEAAVRADGLHFRPTRDIIG
ncbi:hypothetical protein ACWCRC_40670 [Streptomyces sp. NPDC001940]|uniref:hypothetical protein n=1 Tax=Streptomyces TaxID=1883 RepID=UPI001D0B1462|nr:MULTISPECIES: hypothetical protein [Streptomyces]MCX5084311.1 hypothetical protein [Streptomyces sp. NBC_00401]UDM04370.1 hypothetical protein LGI35_42000 [Streptomyces longhuiensis]